MFVYFGLLLVLWRGGYLSKILVSCFVCVCMYSQQLAYLPVFLKESLGLENVMCPHHNTAKYWALAQTCMCWYSAFTLSNVTKQTRQACWLPPHVTPERPSALLTSSMQYGIGVKWFGCFLHSGVSRAKWVHVWVSNFIRGHVLHLLPSCKSRSGHRQSSEHLSNAPSECSYE